MGGVAKYAYEDFRITLRPHIRRRYRRIAASQVADAERPDTDRHVAA